MTESETDNDKNERVEEPLPTLFAKADEVEVVTDDEEMAE